MRTKDYTQFSFMKTNREINYRLVERLMESINEIGFIKSRPILVNEEMLIIDGQHRFEALKQLDLPIHYEITTTDPNAVMLALNSTQSVWKVEDYVKSHANNGIECYQKLVTFDNKHKLGMYNTISICVAEFDGVKKIKQGLDLNMSKNTSKVVEFLIEVKPILSFYNSTKFVKSIVSLANKVDESKFKKVLSKIHSLRPQGSVNDYLLAYENILNKYKKSSEATVTLVK